MMYLYTCEHVWGLYEGSSMDGEDHRIGAINYAKRCPAVDSIVHRVFVHDIDTCDQVFTVNLNYDSGEFKVIDVQNVTS